MGKEWTGELPGVQIKVIKRERQQDRPCQGGTVQVDGDASRAAGVWWLWAGLMARGVWELGWGHGGCACGAEVRAGEDSCREGQRPAACSRVHNEFGQGEWP